MERFLIALDLDDTLYLERDYVRSGFKAVDRWLRTHRCFNDFFDEAWELFEKGQRSFIFNLVFEKRGFCDQKLIGDLIEVYHTHQPSISLMPDAEEFLQNHQKDELVLITDGLPVTQWAKINALGIKKYIGKILVTDDLGPEYRKPHPEAYLRLQGALSGKKCVYIADNPQKDFIAPKNLGWLPSIRIRHAGSLHFDLSTPDNCVEVTSFDDVTCQSIFQRKGIEFRAELSK